MSGCSCTLCLYITLRSFIDIEDMFMCYCFNTNSLIWHHVLPPARSILVPPIPQTTGCLLHNFLFNAFNVKGQHINNYSLIAFTVKQAPMKPNTTCGQNLSCLNASGHAHSCHMLCTKQWEETELKLTLHCQNIHGFFFCWLSQEKTQSYDCIY